MRAGFATVTGGSPHHGPRLSHGGAVFAGRIGGHARRCIENPKFGTIETTMISKSKFAESWPVVAAFAARGAAARWSGNGA
jgi:hypothetical protein